MTIANHSKQPIYICTGLSVIPRDVGYWHGLKGQASTNSGLNRTCISPQEEAQEIHEGTVIPEHGVIHFPVTLPAPNSHGDLDLTISAQLAVGTFPRGVPSDWSKVTLKIKKKIHVLPAEAEKQ